MNDSTADTAELIGKLIALIIKVSITAAYLTAAYKGLGYLSDIARSLKAIEAVVVG